MRWTALSLLASMALPRAAFALGLHPREGDVVLPDFALGSGPHIADVKLHDTALGTPRPDSSRFRCSA